ncbi:MAG: hypothetical protein O2941_05575, partial [Cyanobacteria bacterium]|nr:hypothetical protein [Cyanobacteriota bacterium]
MPLAGIGLGENRQPADLGGNGICLGRQVRHIKPLPEARRSRIAAMELNADLNQRAVLDSNALDWTPSPLP